MILAAGKGERMRPLTNELPKALVNVAGRTLLEWAIERYKQSEIDDIVIAVGWKGDMIEDFVSKSDIKTSVVHVPKYEKGPLQTLLTAIESFDGDFLLSPVDAMIEPATVMGIQAHHSDLGDFDGMTLAVAQDAESGTPVELGNDGLLTGIGDFESNSKNVARSAMMLIAHTRIRNLCKSTLDDGKERVAQLLEQLIKDGTHVQGYGVSQPWFDIDTLSDLLEVNRHLLHRGGFRESNSVFIPSGDSIEVGDSLTLSSNITLGKGTSLRGPVFVASNCNIGEDCKLGPNVTIASNTTLSEGCRVTDAVIFGESNVSSQSRVHRRVIFRSIGYNAEV
ncbi:MAG: NTP transferase domain-containing protein [Candidatus Thorarchaeota archaeon]